MNNPARAFPINAILSPRERTSSLTSQTDSDSTKRRSSSRAIKRPKFDDELVESSLGGQSSTPLGKFRTRNLSLSSTSASGYQMPMPVTPVNFEIRKKLSSSKSSKKSRKNRGSQSVVTKDLGRWKPTDDLALIIGVQQTCDLITVHRGVKFSCNFTLGEVEDRWYALLYDPTVSRIAQQAMKNLHPEQVQAVQTTALFSKEEEKHLAKIDSKSSPTLETFDELLKDNPDVFYPARNAKAINNHWQLMKQYSLLNDQIITPIDTSQLPPEFSDAEQQMPDSELYESSEENLDQELSIVHRANKKEIREMESKVAQWQVIVDCVKGIAPPEFCNNTLAVLRGRLVQYLISSKDLLCSKEITLGRNTAGNHVHIDLSREGPAWKISRRQGAIKLRNTGEFHLANEGKRAIFVDGKSIICGTKAKLNNNSVVEIASLRFIFIINQDLINEAKQENINVVAD